MERVTRLSVTRDGHEKVYTLYKPQIEIGRGSQNDVVILDSRASRRHARLTQQADGWLLEDLNSANGTRVNGAPITRATVAEPDAIEIGSARLHVQWTEPQPAEQSPTLLQATLIESPLQLDQTLSEQPLELAVQDTSVPRLAVHFEGKVWEVALRGPRFSIGRASDNDLTLNDAKVSRHHATLEQRGEHVWLVDRESGNGTFVNDERIHERVLRGDEDIRIGGARLTFKPAFHPEQLAVHVGQVTRQPVVVVPGFLGTKLWRGDVMCWPNLRELLIHPEDYRLPEHDDLQPRGIVDEVVVVPNLIKLEKYTRLVHFLTDSLGYVEGKDLHVFGYDWRKDLRLAARKLADEVSAFRDTLDTPTRDVTILAHSMGCLVTRYFIDRLGGDSMTARCVLMGGPQLGIPKFIVAILSRMMPLGALADRVRATLATFPSVYQTLPTYACVFDEHGHAIDVYADDRWLAPDARAHLQNGLAFRRELSDAARVPTTCIFGYGTKTISKVIVRVTPDGSWEDPQFIEQSIGDDTIPDASAILKGADIHPVQQHHGALFTDNDVKMRLKLELTRG